MTKMIDVSKIEPGLSGEKFLNNRQTLFIGYTLLVLVDLAVLGLLDEYWDRVTIDSFSILLLTAGLLQLLLKITLKIEHRIAAYFKAKPGTGAKVMRWVSAWGVLFGSKFAILAAIELAFGERVDFGGIIPFIVVVIAILIVEQIVTKIYYYLADE